MITTLEGFTLLYQKVWHHTNSLNKVSRAENTSQIKTVFFLLALLLSVNTIVVSQETSNQKLYKALFVKPEVLQKSGELSFNVIQKGAGEGSLELEKKIMQYV